jgi:predicted NBD/HSP70 family sugar kinase
MVKWWTVPGPGVVRAGQKREDVMDSDAGMGTGPGHVLNLIRIGRSKTRNEIQQATGLSRVTVSQRVDALLAVGLIREGDRADSTGGRRPLQLEFDDGAGVVLAMALNTRHATVGVLDLGANLLASEELPSDVTRPPGETIDELLDACMGVLSRLGRSVEEVVGVGMSVPGPVDPHTGRLNEPPIMVGWHDFDVAERVRRRIPVPVTVENDANAMAIGEARAAGESQTLVFLKVSTGIGAGIALNGTIWPGFDGGAGDIGHMRVTDGSDGRVCRCGSTGCLAASASGGAIAARLRETGHSDIRSARDVAELLRRGDPDATTLVAAAGHLIGEVMAAVVCVVNPQAVVVGGDLASPTLLSALVSSLIPRSMPRATRNLVVRLSSAGEAVGLVGMASLVVDDVYSVRRVNEMLQA